jgi:protein involved in polysaccharide export with SLBB domain
MHPPRTRATWRPVPRARVRTANIDLDPMTRSPFATPRHPAPVRAALCAFALGILATSAGARMQFDGNTGNDLTSTSTGNNNASGSDSSGSANQDTGNGTDNGNTNTRNGNGNSTPTLQQPNQQNNRNNRQAGQPEPRESSNRNGPQYQPSEFELYVQRQANASAPSAPIPTSLSQSTSQRATPLVRRFGADLITDASWNASNNYSNTSAPSVTFDPLPTAPGDYIVRPGDEIALTIWGTVNADLRLTVDRAGRIAVPQVGAINVAGLRNADLEAAISKRVGQVFKNYQLNASIGQVRAIRVFVGGYAQRPGSLTLNGMSSVLHALMRAGGPSAAGSFRDIHLRRGGHEVAVFDLYDLLLKGDRDTDQLVQPDDVIFIGPVGTQVAVLGSVNQQAIFETKPGETLDDVLRMAGGFNAVADRQHVAVERLVDRATGHVTDLPLPQHASDMLGTGDVVRVFSAITASVPMEYQNERVRVEGEVLHPGDYVLPAGSKISDALRLAGGLTPAAFPYGTEFTRESVRLTQEVNYDRALRDLETDMTKNQASQRATSAEEISAQSASAASNERLLARLRQIRPTGRVVLQLKPDATALPELTLEDGDAIKVPPRGSSVGVFGSVFTTGSFLFEPGHTTEQYLALAGGPTRGADKDSIFMIRANGSVISARQGATFWHASSGFRDAIVQPGDTLFVPEELDKSTFVQDAKDWTQILYQFGLGLAGIKTLGL